MKQFFVFLSAFLMFLTLVAPASAARNRLSIRNNGANSKNSINLSKHQSKTVKQTTSTTNTSSVVISSNTGLNTIKGNTGGSSSIKSGSVSSLVSILNIGGSNQYTESLCCDDDCNGGGDQCTPKAGWADEIFEANQGTLKNGDPITDPQRINPDSILGDTNDWYSLGKNGSVEFGFKHAVLDTVGNDIKVFEVTNDRGSYPEEKAQVEVSADGSNWFVIGEVTNNDGGDGIGGVDISVSGLSEVNYIRITDTTDYSLHSDDADGYDLRAIYAELVACE